MFIHCIKSDKLAIDGIEVREFVAGEVYEETDTVARRLIELGIGQEAVADDETAVALAAVAEPAPADEASDEEKDADPATENKAVDPVAETKPAAPAKGKKAK
ncbi:hypothetical protein JL101_035325 (plasmid) [Skermanella rosea]|uniref:hypothetical protein n=1 Tax=Skermanella rosea TaxID=1817965 RepID=UPI001933CA08|nr:hypothetical protein [Skermanella rosea]UEM08070.1 hypothetical protein JL101_035325 [Skermanella rosea]